MEMAMVEQESNMEDNLFKLRSVCYITSVREQIFLRKDESGEFAGFNNDTFISEFISNINDLIELEVFTEKSKYYFLETLMEGIVDSIISVIHSDKSGLSVFTTVVDGGDLQTSLLNSFFENNEELKALKNEVIKYRELNNDSEKVSGS